jgi:hypothetical protein
MGYRFTDYLSAGCLYDGVPICEWADGASKGCETSSKNSKKILGKKAVFFVSS